LTVKSHSRHLLHRSADRAGELLIVRPVGRMPLEIDQVNGAVPPVTASGCEYVPVGVALANVVVVMLGTAATVM